MRAWWACLLLFSAVAVFRSRPRELFENTDFSDKQEHWQVWCTNEPCPSLVHATQGCQISVSNKDPAPSKVGVFQCKPVSPDQRLEGRASVSASLSLPEAVYLKFAFFSHGNTVAGEFLSEAVLVDREKTTITFAAVAPRGSASLCAGVEFFKSRWDSEGAIELFSMSMHSTSFQIDPLMVVVGCIVALGVLIRFDGMLRAVLGCFDTDPRFAVMEGSRMRFDALGLGRFMAACHVLMVHVIAAEELPFAGWGTSWIPFFLLLSGFLLTIPRLPQSTNASSQLADFVDFMLKRLVGMVPLYLLSILFALCWTRLPCPIDRSNLLLMLVFSHAWGSSYSCRNPDGSCLDSFACINNDINVPSWFLTPLFLCYILFNPFLRIVRSLSPAFALKLIALLWVLSVAVVSCGYFPLNRYRFNPLCFVHSFFAGMLLARGMRDQLHAHEGQQSFPLVVSFGAVLSTAVLMSIFLRFSPAVPLMHGFDVPLELIGRDGGFIPLHCLLVAGLVLKKDPLAKFGATKLVMFLGDLSYAWFILQETAFHIKGNIFPHHTHATTVAILFVLSITARYLVDLPAQAYFSGKLSNVHNKRSQT